MPYVSPFSHRIAVRAPSAQKNPQEVREDFRGIDLTSPLDTMKDYHSPEARNFRMFSERTDDRRVSIAVRKGSGYYSEAYTQTQDQTQTSTTGAADQTFSTQTGWKAQPFVAGSTAPLTKAQVRLNNAPNPTGHIVIQIYDDNSGMPGHLLATSGILSSSVTSSYAYIDARFVEAPILTSGDTYYIVAYLQDDATGSYNWSSTTSATTALTSDSGMSGWTSTTYALNFKTFMGVTTAPKGIARYAPTSGVNKTLVPIGTSMYVINDNDGTFSSIYDGLSSSASDYFFTYADNKVFWVNGYDDLAYWDKSVTDAATNLAANGTFETNTTGWTAGTGTTMTRDTGTFRTGVASMKLVGDSSHHAVSTYAYTYTKGKIYTLKMYVKGTNGQKVSPRAQGTLGTEVTLTGGWDLLTYTFKASASTASTYGVEASANSQTIYVDDVNLVDTGIKFITHSQLPVLRLATFHKNVLFGVSADDPNKLIWSEAPGNDDGAGNVWYEGYLSTSFDYVPAPKASDPITALMPFQDNLVIFTASQKYVLSGIDPSTFVVRQSTGKKGAVGQNAVYADENYIYFAANDGFYRYNGAQDDLISDRVQPEFANIGDRTNIFVTKWQRIVRFYYQSEGSPVNDRCLLWHTTFEEWMLDTDSYVKYAVPFEDANDDYQLAEVNSNVARVTFAEQDYNILGKPIDFYYACKPDSMGNPAQRKRLVKFYPLLKDSQYKVQVGVDKNLEGNPRWTEVSIITSGAKIGSFQIGDGTSIGGVYLFKPNRVNTSGYAYYWQTIIWRQAVQNPVQFIGYVLSIRGKRL